MTFRNCAFFAILLSPCHSVNGCTDNNIDSEFYSSLPYSSHPFRSYILRIFHFLLQFLRTPALSHPFTCPSHLKPCINHTFDTVVYAIYSAFFPLTGCHYCGPTLISALCNSCSDWTANNFLFDRDIPIIMDIKRLRQDNKWTHTIYANFRHALIVLLLCIVQFWHEYYH